MAGLMQGDHLGLFPGPGTEAGECPLYVPGDDVRLMDWNVSARTTVPHVRDPIFDHELDVWLVADLSPSQSFGTAGRSKRDVVVSVAAGFGVPASRLANRVGAVVLDVDGVSHLPARPGRRHLLAVLHRMVTAASGDGGGRTDLAPALGAVGRLARRRGVVVVISDFLVAPGWERPLARLAARHDVVAAEVLDRRELELPAVGLLSLADAETGSSTPPAPASANVSPEAPPSSGPPSGRRCGGRRWTTWWCAPTRTGCRRLSPSWWPAGDAAGATGRFRLGGRPDELRRCVAP
ncbi:MAG: DUF58 domain-containing protein, partial [Actinomycetota bacterium]|nr:DUF58 domain-containing protein [Actinomycetota bacterium]